MLLSSEKIGGTPLTVSKTKRLSNFLAYSKGIDANVQGRIFTWKKFLRGQLIYEKLDRVIFRDDCLQLFPNYVVTNGPFTCSDHSYVLLNTAPAHLPRKGTAFKYQHAWTCYHETHTLARKNWNAQILGTPMFRLVQKLKRLKLNLKSWSKRTFGNFKHKLERNAESLLRIEQRLVLQPHSARLNNWHFRLVKQREKMHLFNQKYWGKLHRKEWLVNGDRNSRYFQQSMLARKTRSRIVKIKDSSGIWLDNPNQIQQLFVHDFTSRFHSS